MRASYCSCVPSGVERGWRRRTASSYCPGPGRHAAGGSGEFLLFLFQDSRVSSLSFSPTGCNFWIERNCPLVLLPTENTTSALFIVVTFSFDRSLRWAFFLKTELSSTTGTCGLLAHSGPLAQLIPAWPLPAFQSLTLYPKCGTSLRT